MNPKVGYSTDERAEIAAASEELIAAEFPTPGSVVLDAFKNMNKLNVGTIFDREARNDGEGMPRPWIPATCVDKELREQLFAWLDEVVQWLNRQYTWDTAMMIPPCWLMHPHIVNELAVLASRRWAAEGRWVSDGLEEWHRQELPDFFERMRTRLGHACDDGEHAPWPGNPRHRSYLRIESRTQRNHRLAGDREALKRLEDIAKQARKRADSGE